MRKKQSVQLVFNSEKNSHEQALTELLQGADRIDCVVAFAKVSGFNLIKSSLIASLKNGLKARFSVSLDFYLTDPDILQRLFNLHKKYDLELYVSRSRWTFHPKVFAITSKTGFALLVGSANFTSGGLRDNYEASTLSVDTSGVLVREFSAHVDDLIIQEELVEATPDMIEDYKRLYKLYRANQNLAEMRFKRIEREPAAGIDILEGFLRDMKRDRSEQGFEEQRRLRRNTQQDALRIIKALASTQKLTQQSFARQYEQLLSTFHSGGLHRGKNIVAKNAGKFKKALVAVLQLRNPSPAVAYQLLYEQFQQIPRAGVNLLTEILLALDSKRFAIMNQNAVSGLSRADILTFPAKPNKENVSPETYALFCQEAQLVRDQLRLNDFLELDALFNYAYWRHDETDENG